MSAPLYAIPKRSLLKDSANSQRYELAHNTGTALRLERSQAAISERVTREFIVLNGRISREWRLIAPLTIVRELDSEGWWVVSDSIFFMYGTGPTPVAAYEDYVTSLAEYYAIVAESAQSNTYDQAELERLQRYLERIEPGYAQ